MRTRAGTTTASERRLIVEGAPPPRTGAKRAEECDGLTGLPRGERRQSWPQATVPTCAGTTRFRTRGCGSSPTRAAERSQPPSSPTCTAPSQEAARRALTDFLRLRHGGQAPPRSAATREQARERNTPIFLDSPADTAADHLSPHLAGRHPPSTNDASRLRSTSCARIADEPQPPPLRRGGNQTAGSWRPANPRTN